jgi:CheY-like chemotaxis protein
MCIRVHPHPINIFPYFLVKTMNETKTVLIIDDDRDYISAIQALLEASGYKVHSANNGRDGLELAKTAPPDLILLDVMMTERTEGFFVLQEMRRISALRETPVIVASSIYSDEPTFRVDPDAGWLPANLFLAKPIDPERLLTEVARLMGESSKSSLEDGRRQS